MRVGVLAGAGAHHAALCAKLAARVDVATIVLSENVTGTAAARLRRRIGGRVADTFAGRPFADAWRTMTQRCAAEHPLPDGIPVTRVRNVNDAATLDALLAADVDLVAVSGTNLVGRRLLDLATSRRGAVNLHTGLSPYVKGGPNCTNWCLAEGWFHRIGNTVMWLDPGVDSGPVITSARTPLTGRETLPELHWAVIEHAHALYVEVIARVCRGDNLPGTPQSELGVGRTFRTREWDAAARRRALEHFQTRYGPAALEPVDATPDRTVALP